MNIEDNLRLFLDERQPTKRFTSFDYCFNHFQSHRGRAADLGSAEGMELSCLHVGFYLASWGMLRGSSALSRRSLRQYASLIEVIASCPEEVWSIDADRYTPEAIDLLLSTARQVRATLPAPASDTLVTKIMLGVFGCVPAFDTYFRKGFRARSIGTRSLRRIGEFYNQNAEVIDRHLVATLDFTTGQPGGLRYTRAKVIDMVFFIEGGYVP